MGQRALVTAIVALLLLLAVRLTSTAPNGTGPSGRPRRSEPIPSFSPRSFLVNDTPPAADLSPLRNTSALEAGGSACAPAVYLVTPDAFVVFGTDTVDTAAFALTKGYATSHRRALMSPASGVAVRSPRSDRPISAVSVLEAPRAALCGIGAAPRAPSAQSGETEAATSAATKATTAAKKATTRGRLCFLRCVFDSAPRSQPKPSVFATPLDEEHFYYHSVAPSELRPTKAHDAAAVATAHRCLRRCLLSSTDGGVRQEVAQVCGALHNVRSGRDAARSSVTQQSDDATRHVRDVIAALGPNTDVEVAQSAKVPWRTVIRCLTPSASAAASAQVLLRANASYCGVFNSTSTSGAVNQTCVGQESLLALLEGLQCWFEERLTRPLVHAHLLATPETQSATRRHIDAFMRRLVGNESVGQLSAVVLRRTPHKTIITDSVDAFTKTYAAVPSAQLLERIKFDAARWRNYSDDIVREDSMPVTSPYWGRRRADYEWQRPARPSEEVDFLLVGPRATLTPITTDYDKANYAPSTASGSSNSSAGLGQQRTPSAMMTKAALREIMRPKQWMLDLGLLAPPADSSSPSAESSPRSPPSPSARVSEADNTDIPKVDSSNPVDKTPSRDRKSATKRQSHEAMTISLPEGTWHRLWLLPVDSVTGAPACVSGDAIQAQLTAGVRRRDIDGVAGNVAAAVRRGLFGSSAPGPGRPQEDPEPFEDPQDYAPLVWQTEMSIPTDVGLGVHELLVFVPAPGAVGATFDVPLSKASAALHRTATHRLCTDIAMQYGRARRFLPGDSPASVGARKKPPPPPAKDFSVSPRRLRDLAEWIAVNATNGFKAEPHFTEHAAVRPTPEAELGLIGYHSLGAPLSPAMAQQWLRQAPLQPHDHGSNPFSIASGVSGYEDEDLQRMIDAAARAPSGGRVQHQFSQERIDSLSMLSREFFGPASRARTVFAVWDETKSCALFRLRPHDPAGLAHLSSTGRKSPPADNTADDPCGHRDAFRSVFLRRNVRNANDSINGDAPGPDSANAAWDSLFQSSRRSPRCRGRVLSPPAVREALSGEWLLMWGDSTLRQPVANLFEDYLNVSQRAGHMMRDYAKGPLFSKVGNVALDYRKIDAVRGLRSDDPPTAAPAPLPWETSSPGSVLDRGTPAQVFRDATEDKRRRPVVRNTLVWGGCGDNGAAPFSCPAGAFNTTALADIGRYVHAAAIGRRSFADPTADNRRPSLLFEPRSLPRALPRSVDIGNVRNYMTPLVLPLKRFDNRKFKLFTLQNATLGDALGTECDWSPPSSNVTAAAASNSNPSNSTRLAEEAPTIGERSSPNPQRFCQSAAGRVAWAPTIVLLNSAAWYAQYPDDHIAMARLTMAAVNQSHMDVVRPALVRTIAQDAAAERLRMVVDAATSTADAEGRSVHRAVFDDVISSPLIDHFRAPLLLWATPNARWANGPHPARGDYSRSLRIASGVIERTVADTAPYTAWGTTRRSAPYRSAISTLAGAALDSATSSKLDCVRDSLSLVTSASQGNTSALSGGCAAAAYAALTELYADLLVRPEQAKAMAGKGRSGGGGDTSSALFDAAVYLRSIADTPRVRIISKSEMLWPLRFGTRYVATFLHNGMSYSQCAVRRTASRGGPGEVKECERPSWPAHMFMQVVLRALEAHRA